MELQIVTGHVQKENCFLRGCRECKWSSHHLRWPFLVLEWFLDHWRCRGRGLTISLYFILFFVYCIKDGIRGSFFPNFILTATLWSWLHCERMTGPWSLWKYPWQNGYLNLDILVPTLHPLSDMGSLWVNKTGLTSHRIRIVSFFVSHFYYPNDWNGNPVQSAVALNAALHHHFWPVCHICIPLLFTALASS